MTQVYDQVLKFLAFQIYFQGTKDKMTVKFSMNTSSCWCKHHNVTPHDVSLNRQVFLIVSPPTGKQANRHQHPAVVRHRSRLLPQWPALRLPHPVRKRRWRVCAGERWNTGGQSSVQEGPGNWICYSDTGRVRLLFNITPSELLSL